MVKEIIKYLDSFGTKYNFFTDGKPRLYTTFGGILSIISFLLSLIVFAIYSYDDFRRLKPTTLFTSVLPSEYRQVNPTKEKIWIPWRIVNNNNDFINHTELIYPKIYYYNGSRNSINDSFKFNYKLLNYKLCNETSMKDKLDFYYIGIPLEKLYCIDTGDYNIGGSWVSLFFNYIRIDFHLCEDGIDFDENNKKCTTKEKIYKYTGDNNSLKIEFFYPDVQFQPTNKNNPILVLYRRYFYYISQITHKVDRLFLRNHILSDDKGWFYIKIINSSYWGYNSIKGDSYYTQNVKDIVKELSTSIVYSLHIYLETDIMNYRRTYKKIAIILSQSLPIIYIVLLFFRKIAKFFKLAEQKRKMVEMLFENLQKKVNKNLSHNYRSNNITKKRSTYVNYNNFSNNKINYRRSFFNNNLAFLNENKYNNNINDNSSQFNYRSINSNKLDITKNCNFSNLMINPSDNKIVFPKNECMHNIENVDNIYQNTINDNCKKSFNNLNAQNRNSQQLYQKRKHLPEGKFEKMENMAKEFYYVRTVKRKKLFPGYYYFISVLMKNIDITKYHCCLSEKYIGVDSFISRMFDVSSYVQLIRQFQLVKSLCFKDEINLIERNQKLDMNAHDFSRNMRDCIDNQNFIIFAK